MQQEELRSQEAKECTIQKLSTEMLTQHIFKEETLFDFLTHKCALLADGKLKVLSTAQYGYFTFLKENRPINEAHVQALMGSFEKDGYLFTILYVNELMQIIDGQHRFEAAKRKGLPVYFVVMPGWSIKEVAILNVNSKDWTVIDFVTMHAKSGNRNYIRFKEFYDAHSFDVTTCQLILTGKRSGGYASTDSFRLGQLQLDDEQLTEGYLKATKIMALKAFHPKGWRSRNLVEAMLALFKVRHYDHRHLILKLTTYPEMLLFEARSLRVNEYVTLFVEKYNFRRNKDRLFI